MKKCTEINFSFTISFQIVLFVGVYSPIQRDIKYQLRIDMKSREGVINDRVQKVSFNGSLALI